MKPVSRVQPPQPWQPSPVRPQAPGVQPSTRMPRDREGAATSDESLPDVDLQMPVLDTPGGSTGGDTDDQQGQQQGGNDANAHVVEVQDDPGHAAVTRLGGLIAAFCLHPAAVEDQWSIRIPLDAELLADCVLYLHFVRHALHIRFETPDWETRAVLERHAHSLAEQLRADLPGLQDVSVIT